jgi:hypothetical protein
MTEHRAPRARVGSIATILVCIPLVMVLAAFGGSSAKISSSSKLGVGVTPTSVKVGIALADFDCVKSFVDSIRVHQEQVYQAYIDNINAKGGIAGRKIKPVYDSYCPLGSAGPLAVCTKLTDDDKVFAVIGTFVDFSGDAQTCVANQHHRVLMTYNLSQAIMNQSPPGLIIYPGATNERTVKILLQLLNKERALKGKKVAVLGGSAEASTVNKTIVPSRSTALQTPPLRKASSTASSRSGRASTSTRSSSRVTRCRRRHSSPSCANRCRR